MWYHSVGAIKVNGVASDSLAICGGDTHFKNGAKGSNDEDCDDDSDYDDDSDDDDNWNRKSSRNKNKRW